MRPHSLVSTRPSLYLWLEIEAECNITCQFCYNYWRNGRSRTPLYGTTSEILELLTLAFDQADVPVVTISGGEPLLRDDIEEIARFAVAGKARVGLTTNGVLLTEARAKSLVKAGVDTFHIPLHSPTPRVHDELSGAQCWRNSVERIMMLREMGQPVVPVFVATRQNLSLFADVVALVACLDVPGVVFNRFTPGGRGLLHRKQLEITHAETVESLMRAYRVATKLGVSIELGTPLPLTYDEQSNLSHLILCSCPVGRDQEVFVLDGSGNIRPCNHAKQSYGNLRAEPLAKIIARAGIDTEMPVVDGIRDCRYCGTDRSFAS